MRHLYSLLITLLIPFALCRLFYKSIKNPDYRKRIPERLAQLPKHQQEPIIWFHTVSVGEFLATLNLIEKTLSSQKDCFILITTTTPTASKQFADRLGSHPRCIHYYLPFDQPFLCQRFIKQLNLKVAVFVETEIWPNWLYYLEKNQIPRLLVNARLSERSFQSYQKLGKFTQKTIARFNHIACQNQKSTERFQKLGGNASNLGNLKFDIREPLDLCDKQNKITNLGIKDFYIAASTHAPEEQLILKAHQQITNNNKTPPTLVLAPRHPERSDKILALCQLLKLSACKKSSINPNTQVIILDSLGELIYFYSLAKIAVIGGSFTNLGGHNPLEAALFSTPCIIGNSYFNFKEMVDEMKQERAIIVCKENNANVLAKNILQLIDHPNEIAKNSHHYLKKHQGAIDVIYNLIQSHYIDPK